MKTLQDHANEIAEKHWDRLKVIQNGSLFPLTKEIRYDYYEGIDGKLHIKRLED